MRKNVLLGLIIVLLLIIKANADEMVFHDPNIPDGEKLIYREKGNEEDDWGICTYIVKKIQQQGEDVYIITSSARNKKIKGILNASNMKPITVDSTYKQGKSMFSFEKKYRKNNVYIVCPETKIDKTIRIPENTYDLETFFYVFRGLSFTINKKVNFNMFYTEPNERGVAPVDAEVVSKEKIIVPAGEFTCYKVQMKLTGIAALFYKEKFYFWFNAQEPHYLIKHSSTEGEIVELTAPSPCDNYQKSGSVWK